ncbi:MAG: hypothetical protein J6S85_10310 [Methanobrevibacter sp.]|nr:hypothetical protein [Methanobrevibacter sp.]
MSEIKEKVEAELKTVKALCETMEQAIKTQVDRGLDKVNTHELYEAVDIYKDLSEVKKNIVETCYKMQIMEAMEESEYGEDYDEEGPIEERRFYNMNRYANGRFAPKGRGSRRGYRMTPAMYHKYPAEYYRDMDTEDGRMYYQGGSYGSSGGNSGGSGGSRGYSDGYSDGEREGQSRGYEQGNREGYSRGYSEGQRSSGGQRDGREGRSGQSRRSYMESKEMGKDKQEKMRNLETYTDELSDDFLEMMKNASPEEKTLAKNKMQTLLQKIQ